MGSSSVDAAQTEAGISLRGIASSLPGVAALGLAVLYATGALLVAARLRGAHVDVVDTLALVPIQQVLSAGIGTIVNSLLLLIAWLFALAMWWLWSGEGDSRPTIYVDEVSFWRMHRPRRRPQPPKRARFVRLGLNTIFFVLLPIWWFWSLPFSLAATIALGFLSGDIAGNAKKRGRRRTMLLAALFFFATIGLRVGEAFVSPKPLPIIELTEVNGKVDRGQLVAAGDGGWFFVAQPNVVQFLPQTRVAGALSCSRHRLETGTPVLKKIYRWIRRTHSRKRAEFSKTICEQRATAGKT